MDRKLTDDEYKAMIAIYMQGGGSHADFSRGPAVVTEEWVIDVKGEAYESGRSAGLLEALQAVDDASHCSDAMCAINKLITKEGH